MLSTLIAGALGTGGTGFFSRTILNLVIVAVLNVCIIGMLPLSGVLWRGFGTGMAGKVSLTQKTLDGKETQSRTVEMQQDRAAGLVERNQDDP